MSGSWKDRPLNKAERRALDKLAGSPFVVSTAAAFDWLCDRGLAESAGLRVASRGRTTCTLKQSWSITDAGRAAHRVIAAQAVTP